MKKARWRRLGRGAVSKWPWRPERERRVGAGEGRKGAAVGAWSWSIDRDPMAGGAKRRGEGMVYGTESMEGESGFPKPGADSGFWSAGI